jgi:preprotein translocase subunit SecD
MKRANVLKTIIATTVILGGTSFAGLGNVSAAPNEKVNKAPKVMNEENVSKPTITKVDEDTTYFDWTGVSAEEASIIDPTEEFSDQSVDEKAASKPTITKIDDNTTLYDWTGEGESANSINPTALKGDGGPSQIPINDGSGFTWEYLGVKYFNNITDSNLEYYMSGTIVAGLGGVVASYVPGSFLKGVAGYVTTQIIRSIPKGQYFWYTQKKYHDSDAFNTYVKVVTWEYSNSSRTRQTDYYIQVHKYSK